MDSLADWIASISWPIVSRVLASIGLGTVTYTGATAAVSGALDSAKTAFAGMTGDLLQIMVLTGFFDAAAILSGGLVSGLSWMVMKRWALLNVGTN